MERDPQKVSAVLADPTRYKIYQYVLAATHPVSVVEVARAFELHPNVARMHLGKLAEIDLVNARAEKSGKGGRPGFVYEPSGNAVSLSNVPARDFQLLADLLLQSLDLLGDGAGEAIDQIGHTFGRRLGRETLQQLAAGSGDPEAPMRASAQALKRLGVSVHVTHDGHGGANLVLKTCGFQEVAAAHPEHVCRLCKSMVEGITQVCVEEAPAVDRTDSVPQGGKECVYEMNGLIRLE